MEQVYGYLALAVAMIAVSSLTETTYDRKDEDEESKNSDSTGRTLLLITALVMGGSDIVSTSRYGTIQWVRVSVAVAVMVTSLTSVLYYTIYKLRDRRKDDGNDTEG